MLYKQNTVLIISLIFLVISIYGCDNSLHPLDKEKGNYSIYGGLNIDQNENYIRIKKLNIPLDDDTAAFAGRVQIKNLKNGATEVLPDTIVKYDSVRTHNFKTTLSINPDTDYQVTIEGADGGVQTARAKTPAIAEVGVEPDLKIPEDVEVNISYLCATNFIITFKPVRSDEIVRADIGFEYDGQMFWLENKIAGNREEAAASTLIVNPRVVIDKRLNPDGHPFNLPTRKVCANHLTSTEFVVEYSHLGASSSLSDSLAIPGGIGELIGLYTDSFKFNIAFGEPR